MDVRHLINIYGDPITIDQIKEMRSAIDGDFENSLGFKVFWLTPMPGLDILAGLATYAVEYGMRSEPRALLQNAASSSLVDWNTTSASKDCVEKVQASGRDLINIEVLLLRKHIEMEAKAKYAVKEFGKALTDTVGSFFNKRGSLEMNSSTLNPLADQSQKCMVILLQKMADMSLSNPQAENVELILSKLKESPTVLDVVDACINVPGLREFAERLGAFCLPGNGYKTIFDREYGGHPPLPQPLAAADAGRKGLPHGQDGNLSCH